MEVYIKILRWIAVPFAAILGMVVFFILGKLLMGINDFSFIVYAGEKTTSLTKIISEIAINFFAGCGFVYCAIYTAPNAKKVVSVVFTTIMCMFVIAIFLFFIKNGANHSVLHYVNLLVTCIGTIACTVYLWGDLDNNDKK